MTRVLIVAAIIVPAALILWLGHFAAGVTVCTLALLVIWWYGYRACRADRERRRRHREAVWARRDGPYIEYRNPDDPPVWPRYTIQPGTPHINQEGIVE